MKYLKSVDVWKEQITSIFDKTATNEKIADLFKVNQLEWCINYSTELKYLDKCASMFSSKWRYDLLEYEKPKNWI